jgi:hypothetical protein
VTATFSEALDLATISSATFSLRDAANALVPASFSYAAASHTATLDPTAALAYSSTYTATVRGGASGVHDAAGNQLAADVVWSFTIQAPPPPGPEVGPGGPILLVTSNANPFTKYYAEILRTEGLNAFATVDIGALNAAALAAHELVVLGERTLSRAQVTLLSDWVNAGGKLLAFRPDAQLAPLLGLAALPGTYPDAYLWIESGWGSQPLTLQFHGPADQYSLGSAVRLASLATAAGPSALPAVTLNSVGSNGGQAGAWAFDLARSVVQTRQGNPAWAGTERDGVGPIRSDDLFFGAAAGDPQPDWVDLSRVAIPQADVQQRLFARQIRAMLGHPFPSFWYLPSFRKAVVVMTGDEHASGDGTRARWSTFAAASAVGCSVDDWQCVRGTSYVYPTAGGDMSNAEGVAFTAQGFELALHVNTGCSDWTPASLESDLAGQLVDFSTQFPSVPAPVTNRTHCIVWSDWASEPVVELAHQIRLDTNYYYWPPNWVQDHPGFFTGSGMPMRFAQTDGSFIDVYQATTQMTEESGQSFPFTIDTLLDRALGPQEYYGAFTANIHTDLGPSSSDTWAADIVASAQARGVAVVTAKQLLTWLDGRNASTFGSPTWNGQDLAFSVVQGLGARNLRALLPASAGTRTLASLTRGGSPVAYSVETIGGASFAVFAADSGSYVATYQPDATPPVLSALAAMPVLDVDKAKSVIKRSIDPGFVETDTELYTADNVKALSGGSGIH